MERSRSEWFGAPDRSPNGNEQEQENNEQSMFGAPDRRPTGGAR